MESDEANLRNNVYGHYSTWALRAANGQVVPDSDLVLIDSGIAVPEINIAFVLPGAHAPSVTERAYRFFSERSRPWRMEAPLTLQQDLDAQARSAQLSRRTTRRGLVLSREDLNCGPDQPELTSQTVDSAAQAAVFEQTLAEGMVGLTVPTRPPAIRPSVAETTCYLGFVSGQPVTTAVLHKRGSVPGIYAVATIPRARRQGFGRAITERAVVDGFEAGCRVSFLQATEMGRPIYEAVGYRWVFDRPVWSRVE